MIGVSVRLARPDELAAIADLRWRWGCEGERTPSTTHREFVQAFVTWARENEASHRCLVLLRGGVPIGMAWLALVPRVPHVRALERRSGDVQCVYVAPEERDNGLGALLIQAVVDLANDLGLERVTVHSSDRAISAYRRGGFTESARLLQWNNG